MKVSAAFGPNSSQMPELLRMARICKDFPGVRALRDVDLVLESGECLALLGENGAGKSTLMRILSGAEVADSGQILIEGLRAHFSGPRDAIHAGIAMIHQEVSLVEQLSAGENILLGAEPCFFSGVVKRGETAQIAEIALRRVGADIHADDLVSQMSVAQKQLVEIARALSRSAKIVVMDEPTSALTHRESENLFDVIKSLTSAGVGVIYITHKLEEIEGLCNRIVILRDGARVFEGRSSEIDSATIVRHMVGREVTQQFPVRAAAASGEVLSVRSLATSVVKNASLSVHAGEIVGIAGLVGAGRTELVRAIFGADRIASGEIVFDGKPFTPKSPEEAVAKGMGLLTEDRKLQGLALDLSIFDNATLAALRELSQFGVVDQKNGKELVTARKEQLSIRTGSIHQLVGNLSGGNQQKVVLAKWLIANCKLLIFDEPTRGIDVGAKAEIYKLMAELAEQGTAILMVSSELQEIAGLCDRIYVMRRGEIRGELPRGASQEDIMGMAFLG